MQKNRQTPPQHIRRIAVLGSGVMGSQIACHFANIGVEVYLLDIIPESAKNSTDATFRNKIVNDAIDSTLKLSPSPIYKKNFSNRISVGNFEDDFHLIADCDWIIEVVVEKLDIKQEIFAKVDQYRKNGSIVSSNTSGIPIHLICQGRSEDFKKHFCGTHFFNPPRYLQLLEIIPTKHTSEHVVNFLMQYGEKFLGKTTVLCKDTPAFISNRIGVFSIASILQYVDKKNISIETVDLLTGTIIGRPKSATFRTADVVGIDTFALVANGLHENLVNDEAKTLFQIPQFVQTMIDKKLLGSKTGQGFYKKVKLENGKNDILSLNLETMEYQPTQKLSFPILETAKNIDNLADRFRILLSDEGEVGNFYRTTLFSLFTYASHRLPEIANHLYQIDDAIEAGFAWKMGVFKIWDAIGLTKSISIIKAHGHTPAKWIEDMLENGCHNFYKIQNGKKLYYDISKKEYLPIPGMESFILLDNFKDKNVWSNNGTTITDIGDGILNVEIHTKMNSIGGEVLEGINKAIDLAESSYKGIVISNEGENFSAGANVALIFMMAIEQEYDELDFAIKHFQQTMMRLRYSAIPVVAAPHNMTLGGGCEICLHSDKVVAHAETYMGLVEFGVGLIPGGGGTKEFALRIADELKEGDIELNVFKKRFLTIGQAKVSTSAHEAFDLGYLLKGRDRVIISRNRLLAEAKKECLALADAGYTQPIPRKDIRVLGKTALGLAYLGADSMLRGHYISEHDAKISQHLAYVLAGGDLSQPSLVSEQYLLDLEREAFIRLCTERKTLERLQSILNGGKALRN